MESIRHEDVYPSHWRGDERYREFLQTTVLLPPRSATARLVWHAGMRAKIVWNSRWRWIGMVEGPRNVVRACQHELWSYVHETDEMLLTQARSKSCGYRHSDLEVYRWSLSEIYCPPSHGHAPHPAHPAHPSLEIVSSYYRPGSPWVTF